MGNQDIRWTLDTLKTSMRLLEITNREVEGRMGWSHGYLSRIFSGTIELRVEHVLEIVAILGLTPAEFWNLAYPRLPDPPSTAASRLRSLLRRYQPADASVPDGTSDELIDVMRRLITELRKVG